MELVIRGRNLPGRDVGPWRDVHVGLQVGREPTGLTPADAQHPEWVTTLDVDGALVGRDFHGAAVQGRQGGRFVYLTWGEGTGDDFAMFRRAKLMLADLPITDATVVVDVDLTADDGTPRCARLPPSALSWTAR